jgi:hypothetical protein
VEALAMAGQKADYSRRAGLGPWTQLGDEALRLQMLGHMGDHTQVLAEVDHLRAAMARLPARRDASETVIPWNVREVILSVGHSSAQATGTWQLCMELNGEHMDSKRERGAGVYEVARCRFHDAWPLIKLGRLAEAERLLIDCQRVFEDHADTPLLATTLGTRATLENALGRRQAATDLGRAALRLVYVRPEPRHVATAHHNLAMYLGGMGGDRAGQRAHLLAAALIRRLAGMAHDLADTVRALAGELRADDGGEAPPSTVTEVIATAELTEGVRLGKLLAGLQPDPRVVDDVLAEILAAAALPPEDSRPDVTRYLREWEPVIAASAVACQAGQGASAEFLEFLDGQAKAPGWAALAAILRRIVDGERGDSLLDGLDEIDAAIARETLARIAQER